MNTTGRNQQPAILPIEATRLPLTEERTLPNGIPLYVLNGGDQELNRIDILFGAGSYHQDTPLASRLTVEMLKEGTASYSAAAIAERLDYLGSWLQSTAATHHTGISLYSLNRCFDSTLELAAELVRFPRFPEEEFQTLLERKRQQFRTDREKVRTMAINAFYRQLFGVAHPYGRETTEADFDRISSSDLKRFHENFYRPHRCKILLSGRVTPAMVRSVERTLGSTGWNDGLRIPETDFSIRSDYRKECFVEKEQALQSAVFIGTLLPVDRVHSDFPGLQLLSTLLGGYFGSRLMSNIREEKGYTYGISAGISVFPKTAMLSIFSQTGTSFTRPLIREAFTEIERLRNELVPVTELERVKRFLAGESARISDTPFSIADAYLTILTQHLPYDYHFRLTERMLEITPEELQRLSGIYLVQDAFYTAIAGKLD